jgi:cysteine desulfuration protein SufE
MSGRANDFANNPLGSSITLEDVYDAFELLDDWEDRYAFIIDLGKQLPPFPDAERTEKNYVHGCQSQVWLIHHFDKENGKLLLLIDSDAIIVRGLAAIILLAFNNLTPTDLLATDIDKLFERLDLFRHISPTRGNGLRSMISKIRTIATANTA